MHLSAIVCVGAACNGTTAADEEAHNSIQHPSIRSSLLPPDSSGHITDASQTPTTIGTKEGGCSVETGARYAQDGGVRLAGGRVGENIEDDVTEESISTMPPLYASIHY